MSTREEVEYHLAGLADELRDGLARLERADAANDHVVFYRRAFDRDSSALRAELNRPVPNPYKVAVHAMQAAWLARIWPVLSANRAQDRGPRAFEEFNTQRQAEAATKRARCEDIAASLKRPTPAKILARYAKQWPKEPAPSVSTIRRYLASPRNK